MPPLRERPEDILLLANHALHQAAAHFGREVTGFAPEAIEALHHHDWPGNVRELMAVVRRAVVIGDSPLVMLADLTGLGETPHRSMAATVRPLPGSDEERGALMEALAGTQENITLTAQELGVSRVTLYRMLRRHSIMLKSRTEGTTCRGRGVARLAEQAALSAVGLRRMDHRQCIGKRVARWGNRAFRTAGDDPGSIVANHQPGRALCSRLEDADHGSGNRAWPWPRCQVLH